jgi:hypothetical protein
MILDDLHNHRPLVIEAQMATGLVFDGDRIINERIYANDASLFAQNGRAELLALAGTAPQ